MHFDLVLPNPHLVVEIHKRVVPALRFLTTAHNELVVLTLEAHVFHAQLPYIAVGFGASLLLLAQPLGYIWMSFQEHPAES